MDFTLPPATPIDLGLRVVRCEFPGCEQAKPANTMVHLKVSLANGADPRIPGFECPQGGHMGCTLEHAIAVNKACVEQHMKYEHDRLLELVLERARVQAAALAQSEANADATTPATE